jgi:hypothetical protein
MMFFLLFYVFGNIGNLRISITETPKPSCQANFPITKRFSLIH